MKFVNTWTRQVPWMTATWGEDFQTFGIYLVVEGADQLGDVLGSIGFFCQSVYRVCDGFGLSRIHKLNHTAEVDGVLPELDEK